jgi:hypothetical protein
MDISTTMRVFVMSRLNSKVELKKPVKHLTQASNFVKFFELYFIFSKYLFYNSKTLKTYIDVEFRGIYL